MTSWRPVSDRVMQRAAGASCVRDERRRWQAVQQEGKYRVRTAKGKTNRVSTGRLKTRSHVPSILPFLYHLKMSSMRSYEAFHTRG